MRLSSMLPAVPDVTAASLRDVVEELDGVIKDIRTTIFDLQTRASVHEGLRSSVLELTADAGDRLGFQPRVEFDGPVDSVGAGDAGDQMLAVLREALSNVIRHAHATAVAVEIEAGSEFILRVSDDGVGPATSGVPGEGLRNMEVRATSLGGTCHVMAGRRRGTVVEWRVPLGVRAPAS
jgi:signal transduction histidine kinase